MGRSLQRRVTAPLHARSCSWVARYGAGYLRRFTLAPVHGSLATAQGTCAASRSLLQRRRGLAAEVLGEQLVARVGRGALPANQAVAQHDRVVGEPQRAFHELLD